MRGLPDATLRIQHDNAGPYPRATGCEVLVDGEPVANLPITGYSVDASVDGVPSLVVRTLAGEIGLIATLTLGGKR